MLLQELRVLCVSVVKLLGTNFPLRGSGLPEPLHKRSRSVRPLFVVAVRGVVGLVSAAVRSRGGEASEPRQALIGATVVCPHLPRFPGGTFCPTSNG